MKRVLVMSFKTREGSCGFCSAVSLRLTEAICLPSRLQPFVSQEIGQLCLPFSAAAQNIFALFGKAELTATAAMGEPIGDPIRCTGRCSSPASASNYSYP